MKYNYLKFILVLSLAVIVACSDQGIFAADGKDIKCEQPEKCTVSTTLKKELCTDKMIFSAKTENGKIYTKAVIDSECGKHYTDWQEGILKNFKARCMSPEGKTCQCHKSWESNCNFEITGKWNTGMALKGTNIQFDITATTPTITILGECFHGQEKCEQYSLMKCEKGNWVDYGESVGKCKLTEDLSCKRQGGTIIEQECCTGGASFSADGSIDCTDSKKLNQNIRSAPRCKGKTTKNACMTGKTVPEKTMAVKDKVFNIGGILVGCGTTEKLAALKETKSTTKTIQKTQTETTIKELNIGEPTSFGKKNPVPREGYGANAYCPKNSVLCNPHNDIGYWLKEISCCPVNTNIGTEFKKATGNPNGGKYACPKDMLPCGITHFGGYKGGGYSAQILCCSAPHRVIQRTPYLQPTLVGMAYSSQQCEQGTYVCGIQNNYGHPGFAISWQCCKAEFDLTTKETIQEIKIEPTQTKQPLITFLEPCSIIDAGKKYLCSHENKFVELTNEADEYFALKKSPIINNAQTSGCCPINKCWDGSRCINTGETIQSGNTTLLCEIPQ
ncbi:hypothetical protein HY486_03915 [Candidatus Woesearchaeota archaeon]|nr:hypothetical protein [Candidatus Woesearchaeota archaeon]